MEKSNEPCSSEERGRVATTTLDYVTAGLEGVIYSLTFYI